MGTDGIAFLLIFKCLRKIRPDIKGLNFFLIQISNTLPETDDDANKNSALI